jgi:hypothetical protein
MRTCASPAKSSGSSVPRRCGSNPITHRTLRTPLQNPTARSDGCWWEALAEAKQDAIGRFGLCVPLRWRPAHGYGRSRILNVIAHRAQVYVRLEHTQSAARRYKQEIHSFKSRCKAVFCVPSPRLQREKCSLSSSSRLTLPSRGRLPGYALQPPLMSNVRRLSQHSTHALRRGSRAFQIAPRGAYVTRRRESNSSPHQSLHTPLPNPTARADGCSQCSPK